MSKEVMIGMLKVAKNGNDLLQILDALTDTNEETISSEVAVDFVGEIVNFWWYWERGKMNKQNTLTREQIQSLFVNYLNTLSDKELTKLVIRVKPELIENITLSVS